TARGYDRPGRRSGSTSNLSCRRMSTRRAGIFPGASGGGGEMRQAVRNQGSGVAKMIGGGGPPGLSGPRFHLTAAKMLGQSNAPHRLADACRGATSDGLLASQHVGFDLVVADLDLPPFVVKADELVSGVGLRIHEARQQHRRSKALAVVMDRAHHPDLG